MAIYSEIGRLRRVMVHRPGPEVEEMTPSTAQQLLYNEIVPVESVQEEHDELREVLSLVAETVELEDVLVEVASTEAGRRELASALSGGSCTAGGATARAADAALTGAQTEVIRRWADTSPEGIVRECIVGFRLPPRRLQNVVSGPSFVTPPVPNLYFTRDAGFVVHERAYRSAMASPVRAAEAALTAVALAHLGVPVDETLAADRFPPDSPVRGDRLADPTAFKIEGGDVLVLDGDTVILGLGQRSSAAAIDPLLESISRGRAEALTALVVELPLARATIHLDMVVTVIGDSTLLAYEPMVRGPAALPVHVVTIPPGDRSWSFDRAGSLEVALDRIGRSHAIVPCGGVESAVVREREQWFSGCNSVAVAPGTIVVYRNNTATLDALDTAGFSVVTGEEVCRDPSLLRNEDGTIIATPTAVAVNGVELARGGGGPRCMTMPLDRDRE
jgi:arginine deiminase